MYSPVKIEAVTENPAHIIFVGLLNLERFKPREATYAMSFIPISFPTLKRRRPEKNKYVIYQARKKNVPLVLCTARGLRGLRLRNI